MANMKRNWSSMNRSFERLGGRASTRSKDVARSGGPNVLNNITCRFPVPGLCRFCRQEHPTSIHAEVTRLLNAVPQLGEVFLIKEKIGEGTFSSVYLAQLKRIPLGCSDDNKYVALKHVIPTSLPSRILLELNCMDKFGVHPNIIGLHSCVRQGPHVVMVMPYFPHDRFCDYVSLLDINEISSYMRNLLDALRFVHREGIIHRDIKPSNFLYNRRLKKFALVDFGLAQTASNTGVLSLIGDAASQRGEFERLCSDPKTALANKSFMRLLPTSSSHQGSSQNTSHHQLTIRRSDFVAPMAKSADGRSCECTYLPQICQICMAKPVQRACRAGTPGFRPPEVLLKYPHQTTAVDMWSAGVIFICLLTGRYPFFHGSDDLTALTEITVIFGTKAIGDLAASLGKFLQCSPTNPPIALKTICERLRPEIKGANARTRQWSLAMDLLTKLLDVNPHTRISASSALQHPLFTSRPAL